MSNPSVPLLRRFDHSRVITVPATASTPDRARSAGVQGQPRLCSENTRRSFSEPAPLRKAYSKDRPDRSLRRPRTRLPETWTPASAAGVGRSGWYLDAKLTDGVVLARPLRDRVEDTGSVLTW